jgi:hypothetical protein
MYRIYDETFTVMQVISILDVYCVVTDDIPLIVFYSSVWNIFKMM